jgi:protein-disulfide isomerase
MTNQVETKRRKKKKQQTDFTPFIIIGVVALVVLAVVIISNIKPKLDVIDPVLHKAEITDGLTMGDPNAPVKVIEFADFQCPGCGNYWSTIEPDIIKNYVATGKVFYTFAPFSFVGSFVQNNPWDESIKSAEAAFCANDQGKFWDYRDYVFGNQSGENQGHFSREMLIAFAQKLELDKKAFTKCLDSGTHNQDVLDANDYAVSQGISSTPSFMVNGEIVQLQTETDLADKIDAVLSK